MAKTELAQLIDHTLLSPDATRDDLLKACDEAKQFHFASVCVNSKHIPLITEQLKSSQVMPICVVDFPKGEAPSAQKAAEAKLAVSQGAREIDMVIAVAHLKNTDYAYVLSDIEAVVKAASPAPVKVILETGALTQTQKIAGCVIAKLAGAAFVKTSTGFGTGGASVEDVALMREVVGPNMGVKASGGVRTRADAERMIAAGATRIGTSASVAIVTNQTGGGAY